MIAAEHDQKAIEYAAKMLEEYFGEEAGSAQIRQLEFGESLLRQKGDALVKIGRFDFRVDYKSQSFSGRIHQAVQHLKDGGPDNYRHYIPLLVVPYMGDIGKSICESAHINWMDLSGNARIIIGQRIRVIIDGKPNMFKRRGRPKDLFAPAASRIVRWFLLHENFHWPEHAIAREMASASLRSSAAPLKQIEIAEAVSASEATVSKVVNRLIQEGEVARNKDGLLRLVDATSLLESWREAYDIHKHKVIRGSMFARSGPELMRLLSAKLVDRDVKHAMTGLAGAWLYDHFANFRTVSLYLRERPSDALLADLAFKEDDKAANVWLILPNDMGVFDGAIKLEDVPVVHQLQVYLDLKSHAERAEEAAEHLRAHHLNWTAHG